MSFIVGDIDDLDRRVLYLLRNPDDSPVERQVEVVDTATGQIKTPIALRRRPGLVKMRVSPDGRQLYILQLLYPG